MRFLTAGLLFVASIVLVIFGIGERTVWAGPSQHTISLQTSEDVPFYKIPNSAFLKYPGKPTVTVRGTGNVFAATGRESDIDAWLGDEANAVVTFGKASSATVVEKRSGVRSALKPVGSDLWRSETTGAGRVRLFEFNPTDENALLLARDGVAAAPGSIKIVWQLSVDQTLSNYLLIAGSIALISAFFINFYSLMRLRRDRRPRRKLPKAPQGPRSRPKRQQTYAAPRGRRSAKSFAIAAPIGLLTLGLLSGCSLVAPGSSNPTPTATNDASQPPAALTSAQIKHILVETAYDAKLADSGADRHSFTNRFDGPALEIRNVYYYLQSRQKGLPSLPAISSFAEISLPAADKNWPRTFLAVTRAVGANAVPQTLVFQQDSPRANYKVWYTVELHQKTPLVASAAVGAVPTAPDSGFLVVRPDDIVRQYGDAINNPTSSPSLSLFDLTKDDFYQGIVANQAKNTASLKNAKVVFSHVLGSPTILGLNTLSNGALIALYMQDITTTKPKKATQAIVVSGLEKVLLGSAGSPSGITTTYGDMMLFFVPNTNGGKAQLLGYTSGLIKVKALR
jgi:hypothetical protein